MFKRLWNQLPYIFGAIMEKTPMFIKYIIFLPFLLFYGIMEFIVNGRWRR